MWTVSRTTYRKICQTGASFFSLYFFLGCSAASSAPKKKVDKNKDNLQIQKQIYTGPIELTQRDQSRQPLWSLFAKNSQVTYRKDQTVYGLVHKVNGTFYENHHPVTHFKANTIEIDQLKNTLSMKDGVELVSKKFGFTLQAKEIQYQPLNKKLIATGDVNVQTDQFKLGPFKQIQSLITLEDLGTPDQF